MDADPAGNSILFNLLLLLFFTLLNAFFAGAEMADSGCDHICGILFVGIGSVGDFACSGAVT